MFHIIKINTLSDVISQAGWGAASLKFAFLPPAVEDGNNEDGDGFDAHTAEITYTHPWRDRWIFDVGVRYYQQTDAEFYADLFTRPDEQNFVARDKELSEFKDYSVGFGVSYNVLKEGWGYIDKATLNFRYNHIWFEYDNFSDVSSGLIPPQAPKYDFDADLIQLFGSIWF